MLELLPQSVRPRRSPAGLQRSGVGTVSIAAKGVVSNLVTLLKVIIRQPSLSQLVVKAMLAPGVGGHALTRIAGLDL